MGTPPTFAFVGQGKLMLCRPGQPPEPVESPFVQRIQDRAERHRERHGWRDAGGMAWNLGGNPQAAMLAQATAADDNLPARFVSVAAGTGGTMLYSIRTSHVGGLFAYDLPAREERRLVHKAGFDAESLAAHPASGELAFCVRHGDGSTAIGLAQPDGGKHRVATEGDSLDECPSWSAAAAREVVFQSAGIARNAHGGVGSLSPYRIEALDLNGNEGNGTMRVLVEDDAFDYLAPRLAADGTLYAIRRPYEPTHAGITPWRLLLDILLFPFRLLMAIAAVLNFISMFARNQPLYSAGGPRRAQDARPTVLWGRVIDTKKALAKSGKEQSLVGKDWVLVRRENGLDRVLAERVLHFDLCPQGVLCTNGSRVWLIDPAGEQSTLATGQIVERVAAVA